MDTNYQVQGYIGPQTRVPHPALQGATAAVAKLLNEKWGVIGYVCVEYQTHLDPVDQAPRLQAVGLKLGLSPAFLGVGAAALAGSKGGDSDLELAKGQLPSSDRTHSKNFVYLPYGYHRPLSTSRDDIFLRVCKMNGVGLDVESRSGTLFFHIDAMIGGSISTLCMANSRRRAVDVAIHTLSFIIDHFGKDIDDDIRCYHWEALPSILSNLRILSKREKKKKKDITNY